MSGGQGVSFGLHLDTHWALSLVDPDFRVSFRTVEALCGVRTPAGMAVSGHTSPPWLRGFPYYGVVPETERITKMDALSFCE